MSTCLVLDAMGMQRKTLIGISFAWSVVIIIQVRIFFLLESRFYKGPKLTEIGNINTNVFHEEYFQFLMDENIIWVVMTQWLPKQFVLKEEKKFHFQLRKNCLKK